MTHVNTYGELAVLLVGSDVALLEGLSQSFAALGYAPRTALSLHDAREVAIQSQPLIAVVERLLAAESSSEALAISLVPGGALVLYHPTDDRPPVAPALMRAVIADLTLPLERNRLLALAQRIQERVRATGRARRDTPPEQRQRY
jgi:DNA-binding NtrC family response regulator